MLLQAVLLVFAFFGIAALVVDLGYVRLSQVQMQSGADTAALEGLRGRDELGEAGRRDEARLFVTRTYLDPAGERLVGAGPEPTLSGGITGGNASQLLSVSADPVYRPALEPNLANATHGDMVAGTYTGGQGAENGAYERTDFDPAGTGAFLVRLRRTDGRNPLDTPDGATVSTGRSLPLLFGLGTTLQGAPGADYNVRFDGITVRAAAIADGRPARRVSSGFAAPFGLTRTYWDAMPDGAPVAVSVDGAGVLSSGGAVAGLFLTGPVNRVGLAVTPAGAALTVTGTFYVPLYEVIGGASRVVGFGYLSAASGAGVMQLARTRNRMAGGGASVHVAEGFAGVPNLDLILAANNALDGPLLVPALVR
ncbi:MAG: pilus assembly protein TadG-related protein [Bryobacteraceae bacterium]